MRQMTERLIQLLTMGVAAGEIDEAGAAAFFRDHIDACRSWNEDRLARDLIPTISHSLPLTTATSPTALPNSASAIGETWRDAALRGVGLVLADDLPRVRLPSSSSIVTVMPKRTTSLSGSGTDSSAFSRRAVQ